MDQGPLEKQIIEQAIRMRQPLPKKIADAPQLLQGLEFFYVAFMDLTTSRSIGMGEGPIPWHVVNDYCDRYEIDGEQREDVHYYITAMDSAYLQYRANEAKKKVPEKGE